MITLAFFIISTGFVIVCGGVYLLLRLGIWLAGFGAKCISDKIETDREEYWKNQNIIDVEPETIPEIKHGYYIFDVIAKKDLDYTDDYEYAIIKLKRARMNNPNASIMIQQR